jgi:hypothetical protein
MPVPTSNQGAESKRWLVPLLANSGGRAKPAWSESLPPRLVLSARETRGPPDQLKNLVVAIAPRP